MNNIGDAGIAALMPGLTVNTSVEELSLASCGIGDQGMALLFTALKTNNRIKNLDLGYAPSTRVLGAKANQLSAASAHLLMEYVDAQSGLVNLNLGKMELPEAYRNILIEEIEKRNGGNLEMDRYQSKGKYPVHADSKAIKSVYR